MIGNFVADSCNATPQDRCERASCTLGCKPMDKEMAQACETEMSAARGEAEMSNDQLDNLLENLPDDELNEMLPEIGHSLDEAAAVDMQGEAAAAQQCCWGQLLSATSSRCTPGFTAGRGHFKNKFCPTCRSAGFHVPVSRLRALTATQTELYQNGMGSGLWTDHRDTGLRFRLINQTLKCTGPHLIILHVASAPPPADLLQPPAWWVDMANRVHLMVSKGTLSPTCSPDNVPPLLLDSGKAAGDDFIRHQVIKSSSRNGKATSQS